MVDPCAPAGRLSLLAIEFIFRMQRLSVAEIGVRDDAVRPPEGPYSGMNMTWQMASLLLLGGSTVLLFAGMPVAISFVAINLIGALLFLGGDAGLHQVARNSVAAAINFSLTPIPLFILMGEVLFHTGLALKVIDGVERLIRQVPDDSPLLRSSPERYSRRFRGRLSRRRRCSVR